MKKLGKLSINVDKLIKNEELVNLRGGDYYDSLTCTCYNSFEMCFYGFITVSNENSCEMGCEGQFGYYASGAPKI